MTNLPILLGLFFAAAYFPLTSSQPSWSRSVIKTIPLLAFAIAAFVAGLGPYLVAGLFLSALGDFGLSRDGDASFLYGLSAFALAHLAYILHLLGISGTQVWDAFSSAPISAIVLVGLMMSTELWLATHTGHLQWPVRIYVVIIGVMGLSALTIPFGWTVVGAGLFILSDVILAINLFRMSDTHHHRLKAGYAIWAFYIAGQMLILWGGLQG
ncbi:lysoplasmalogenase [Aliiroseovarius sp. F47248L]|uniref:lysoplasmalogenase n=1 Tax=Aliiroseovarius sp. F47248L TaxID=2926420 RepID=UPI001FF42734|nr:lysoplasmalogenase [Aliiroseovarius sp. F47248L]MCK0137719.1 lysoplasmalogenase [Aliiroseovarius sp. F47248L]